jgi:hypothetical protein
MQIPSRCSQSLLDQEEDCGKVKPTHMRFFSSWSLEMMSGYYEAFGQWLVRLEPKGTV